MVKAWEQGDHSLSSELQQKRHSPHLDPASVQLLLDSLDKNRRKEMLFTLLPIGRLYKLLTSILLSQGHPLNSQPRSCKSITNKLA